MASEGKGMCLVAFCWKWPFTPYSDSTASKDMAWVRCQQLTDLSGGCLLKPGCHQCLRGEGGLLLKALGQTFLR